MDQTNQEGKRLLILLTDKDTVLWYLIRWIIDVDLTGVYMGPLAVKLSS